MTLNTEIGDGADALAQNQYVDALDGTYWVSGWDATLGTGDLEVDIAAGSGAVGGTDVSTGSTQTIDFTGDPDPTDPRKAVVYVDATGTVQKSLGTPQPVDPSGEIRFRTYNPSPPASVPGVVVAEVWLDAGETVLEAADVRDRRVSNAAVEASKNTPNWVEDDNSPHSFADGAYTLADTYDSVKVELFTQAGDDGFPFEIQVNGDTGSNYTVYERDGTQSTQSGVPIAYGGNANGEVRISGNWQRACSITNNIIDSQSSQGGYNSNVTSPLTSIDATYPLLNIRVYGLKE